MNDESTVVLAAMREYMTSFVEHPHPAFGNLPVCPFAKKARIEDRLLYFVESLDVTRCLGRLKVWDTNYLAVVVVDGRKDFPLVEFDALSAEMDGVLPQEFHLFTAHPGSAYQEHGVYTRREPYPNWQLMRVVDLDHAVSQLKHSHWYEGARRGRDPLH